MAVHQKNKIVEVAVPVPLRRCFYYWSPIDGERQRWQPGMRVRVPFGRRELIGIIVSVMDQSAQTHEKLKSIIDCIDTVSLIAKDIFVLCTWASDYYHAPIGEVLLHALPALLRQGQPIESVKTVEGALPVATVTSLPIALNPAQTHAVSVIQKALDIFGVFLVDGVTGSGKTEVYLQAIAVVLAKNQSVLVLVPEIGLTPQTIERFRARFAVPVVALHSGLTEKKRLAAWNAARVGDARIVIGTRSAVFVSLPDLGLIIVDEEHDVSFKQQDGFRYHARDMAIMRAKYRHIPIVLGSATPALETLCNVQHGKCVYLPLPERAGDAQLPTFSMVDIRHQRLEEGISPVLFDIIRLHLERDEQVMLFLNRRGFAPVLLCHACGWMAMCQRCDTRMTYHQQHKRLYCHHCACQKPLISRCESCGSAELQAIGVGTERLESVLQTHFPARSIARIDRDSTKRKGSMEKWLRSIQAGEHAILIGTQMLAKGHHFPNVTLVIIVDADGGFFNSDFRALERMGQLLLQVAGRAGRAEKKGQVIIQTHHPEHPLLQQLITHGYSAFASTLLAERQKASLPPFVFFALFRVDAHQVQKTHDFLTAVKALFLPYHKDLHCLGPVAAPMPRRAGRYREQLLIQSDRRAVLHRALKEVLPAIEKLRTGKAVRWSLDVDPVEMF